MAGEQTPIRVFLVAPALVRWGLERLLSAAPHIELAGAGDSLLDAAEEIESQFPDLVVVDGNDCAVGEIRSMYERAGVKILALSSGGELQPEGVAQWVDTRQSPGSFVRAIFNAASAHGASVRSPRPHVTSEQTPLVSKPAMGLAEKLTPKQRKVLEAMAANPSLPVKLVADRLHMSEHTLRNHLTEIYAKLEVTGRTHLQAVINTERSRVSAGQVTGRAAWQA